MQKIVFTLTAALALSACVESGGVAVTQGDTLSSNCASIHMKTTNGLPMRCGPQSQLPYTLQ